jgi:hypothetical protein
VDSSISVQNLHIVLRLFSIHIKLAQFSQEVLGLHEVVLQPVIVHRFLVQMEHLKDRDDQGSFSAQDNLVDQASLLRVEEISASQMLQKRISKPQNVVQNINSHFSLQKTKKISINSVVQKALWVKNKRKISMTSNKLSLIVLVKKSRLEISSL